VNNSINGNLAITWDDWTEVKQRKKKRKEEKKRRKGKKKKRKEKKKKGKRREGTGRCSPRVMQRNPLFVTATDPHEQQYYW